MTVEEILGVTGRRALARLGARVTAGYLVAAGVGVVLGSPPERRVAALLPATVVVACAGVAGVAVHRLGPPRVPAAHSARRRRRLSAPVALALAVAAGAVATAAVARAVDGLGAERVAVLAGWVLPGVGLGVALAAGPVAGVLALAGLGLALAAVAPTGVDVVVTTLGATVSLAVGCVVHVTTRRGFVATEEALEVSADADVARARAASRLRARRRLDRTLHDTLLSTLTLLAHAGSGVDPHLLRTAAARDLAALRSDRWDEPPDLVVDLTAEVAPPPGAAPPPGGDGATGRPRGARIRVDGAQARVPDPRRVARLDPVRARLAAVRDLADLGGVDLRVHAPAVPVSLAPLVFDAWSGALTECVTNVVRHAGVAAADVAVGRTDDALVTVVVDEGAGFDPDRVPAERLGLAASVRDRLRDVGGDVRVWSRPGHGTVVELLAPLDRTQPGRARSRPVDRKVTR